MLMACTPRRGHSDMPKSIVGNSPKGGSRSDRAVHGETRGKKGRLAVKEPNLRIGNDRIIKRRKAGALTIC